MVHGFKRIYAHASVGVPLDDGKSDVDTNSTAQCRESLGFTLRVL